ncbi:MAG TPA: hypothetical protein VGH34_20320 [Vicinamibacterales bacterium]|jgi:hypothetical protein
MSLEQFQPGSTYDVGTTLGMLFLAEGWAEPIAIERPSFVIPLDELAPDARQSTVNMDVTARSTSAERTIAADMPRPKGPRTP